MSRYMAFVKDHSLCCVYHGLGCSFKGSARKFKREMFCEINQVCIAFCIRNNEIIIIVKFRYCPSFSLMRK